MHRAHLPARERELRSQLAQLAHAKTLVHATINVREVTCGKAGCRCAQGEKHRAVYLVSRIKSKQRQIYVPPAMEQEVREWVKNYHAALELLEQVSEGAWEELRKRKEQGDS